MSKFKFTCPGCKRIESITCSCPEVSLAKQNTEQEIREMEKFVQEYIRKHYQKRGNRLSVNNFQLFAQMKKEFGLHDSLGLIFHHFVGRMIEAVFNQPAEMLFDLVDEKPGDSE